jgi:hypothetical protein
MKMSIIPLKCYRCMKPATKGVMDPFINIIATACDEHIQEAKEQLERESSSSEGE